MNLAEMVADGEFLEGKYAAGSGEVRKPASKENVEVEVKAAKAVDGEVAEEIELLDRIAESIEHRAVLREFTINEGLDVRVGEIDVFPAGVEGGQAGQGGLFHHAKLARLSRLNQSLGNRISARHSVDVAASGRGLGGGSSIVGV